ncbi:MAG: segregation/condensation protein A [Chloroflexi bacterium]|nr:segregation/condensation protein A [Chloroflexota bacterium]
MSKSQYQIELPVFNGPLDLLLHLIERNELDITAISLARVTEQYLAQIEQMKQERIDELMDFLVIGARLVLIKSRALLPQTPVLIEGEEEEDPAEALIRQLKQYRRFKVAAAALHQRELQGYRTYLRVISQQSPIAFNQVLSRETSRVEISITLLAVLELMKRRELTAHQETLFGPIEIRRLTDSPQLET